MFRTIALSRLRHHARGQAQRSLLEKAGMVRPMRLWQRIWGKYGRNASGIVRRTKSQTAAFSASSFIFSTVFQLRAVFGTPIHLSKRSASFDCEKPFGVER